jgi:septum formation topological specificity factor MinE
MASSKAKTNPFYLKDCALIALATGKRAQNLRELREHLRDIESNSIYYHFWGGLLRPRFDNPEYHNDFAIWAANSIHNKILAERLAIIDPVTFKTLDDLREELIDVIEEYLNENEFPTWSKRDDQFEFIRFQLVIFNTKIIVEKPQDLVGILPNMSVGSIFFHFIDGRRRNSDSLDDFQKWLSNYGEKFNGLRKGIQKIDPYFSSLSRLRKELTEVFNVYFKENP